VCIPICGDGIRVAGENCDDGGMLGDRKGCSDNCMSFEPGYTCSGGT